MHGFAMESVELNLTAPYTPQQDGVMEASNKIIINNANIMIKLGKCPKSFWIPTMETVVYIWSSTRSKTIVMTYANGEATS